MEAAAWLVEVLRPLLVLLLPGGGDVAAASADRFLSRPRMYFMTTSMALQGFGVFRRSHLT